MYLIFLGAGASRAFNIPTMQEMVTEFENELSNGGNEITLYQKIRKIQKNSHGSSKVDIESIFSVISGIADETKLRDFGHLPYFYISSNNLTAEFSREEVEQARTLQKKLTDFIKEKCRFSLQGDKKSIYENSYHALFSALPGSKIKYNGTSYSQDWIACTTNYDTLFEEFWADFPQLDDHFAQEGGSQHRFFDITKKSGHIRGLLKLHGSVDWFKEGSGKIVKRANTGFTRLDLEDEVMVFPIQQKDLYLYPWLTLFQELKEHLKELSYWLVIGYAFNDEFIFEAFKELLTSGKNLILINPSGQEIKNKFPEKFHANITVLPIKFGSQYFPSQIKDYFSGTKTITIELKTTSPSIGFRTNLVFTKLTVCNKNAEIPQKYENSAAGSSTLEIPQQINHGEDDVLICKLTMQNTPPYDNDFQIYFLTDKAYSYDAKLFYKDKMLSSDKGVTQINSDFGKFSSGALHSNTSKLFR